MSRSKILGLVLLALVSLFSCTARQDLRLDLGNSANLSLNLSLDSFFLRYLQDLGAGGDNQPVFDLVAITQAMTELGIEVRQIRAPELGRLELEMRVPDPEAIARDRLGLAQFITWRRGTGNSELTITLNQEIIRRIMGTTSLVREEGFEFLLPLPGSSVQGYQDDLIWIFEEYEPADSLERAFGRATIEIDIFTPRDIISSQGPGLVRRDPRRATLTLGVLDALTFSGSRSYRLSY